MPLILLPSDPEDDWSYGDQLVVDLDKDLEEEEDELPGFLDGDRNLRGLGCKSTGDVCESDGECCSQLCRPAVPEHPGFGKVCKEREQKDHQPKAIITSPADGEVIWYDMDYDEIKRKWFGEVTLSGRGTDVKDGTLTGSSLMWITSEVDLQEPFLGIGSPVTVRLYAQTCEVCFHRITLLAKDSDDNFGSETHEVTLRQLC